MKNPTWGYENGLGNAHDWVNVVYGKTLFFYVLYWYIFYLYIYSISCYGFVQVFHDSSPKPIFYVASRGHHADIGGLTPGSMPAHSTCLLHEGAVFKSFKLVENGVFQEEGLVIFTYLLIMLIVHTCQILISFLGKSNSKIQFRHALKIFIRLVTSQIILIVFFTL